MISRFGLIAALALFTAACSAGTPPALERAALGRTELGQTGSGAADPAQARLPPGAAEAVFAGGCFWCIEHDFEELQGVIEAVSGYTGGALQNPRYEDVITETTGHYEAVRVVYDPQIVSYEALLGFFWRRVDPTDAGGQFCDRGPSYRTAIFVTEEQRAAAEASRAALDDSAVLPGPVVTMVLPLGTFWVAEEHHQDYAKKNPVRYRFYRTSCGRDARVAAVWRNAPALPQSEP